MNAAVVARGEEALDFVTLFIERLVKSEMEPTCFGSKGYAVQTEFSSLRRGMNSIQKACLLAPLNMSIRKIIIDSEWQFFHLRACLFVAI